MISKKPKLYRNWLCEFIAYRLPARVVYWAAIRMFAHATTGPFSAQVVPDLTAMDALQRWKV